MDDLMNIVKYIRQSGLLIKGVIETAKNEAKDKKADFIVYYKYIKC